MKNTFLAITSLLLAILFIYIFLFSYTFINFKSEFDLSFKSIEILREINKPPYVNLSFSNSNKYSCEITISHTHEYATAVAVIFVK